MTFTQLDQLKARLDAYRPLDAHIVRNLHENLVLQWTYHSNAIEGNTLTLKETKVALEGITIGGKTLREHFEVINHKEAILMVEDLVSQQSPLTERVIKDLHYLVLKNIDNTTPSPQPSPRGRGSSEAEGEGLTTFIDWYATQADSLHPVERAARVHGEFVKIHPFVDGNGRTARLLMNLELMKSGFPAAVLPVESRLAYYEALDTAHCQGDYAPFIALLCQVVADSFKPYWWALGVEDVA
jgi:Fic family protein